MDEVIKAFWDKYRDADYFERRRLVESLTLVPKKIEELKEGVYKYALVSLVQSYFDDIIAYFDDLKKED